MRKLLLLYGTVLLLAACRSESPRNIILLIGDGMGLPQMAAAYTANHGQLQMHRCPYVGLSCTTCSNALITDSGAGGTALAVGQKTNLGCIGVDTLGNPLPSLLAQAKTFGKRTGISVVCRLCDATPADFCCHSASRYDYDDIIADYLESGVDYIAGGGMYFFTNRQDGRNIFSEMGEAGYHLASTPEELYALNQLPVCAVLADSEYVVAPQRGDLFVRQTMQAIHMLDNPKGFALMVEGSCIDDWCHANVAERVIAEMLDFDQVVGAVLDWAEKDGHTLVVITADHETGGMVLEDGDLSTGETECSFANEGHSNCFVPVYAYGPGADQFTGVMQNAELSQRITRLMKRYVSKIVCNFAPQN